MGNKFIEEKNMKNTAVLLVLLIICIIANGQEGSVEKSTGGIQTGFLGLWLYDELKLSDAMALRGEIGLTARFWNKNAISATQSGGVIAPVLTIEPRWYYDIKKRKSKSKDIAWNSGNFISINIRYQPDWFIITNYGNPNTVDQLAIIPTWGIKRNIGNHFNYEIGTGFGYQFISPKATTL